MRGWAHPGQQLSSVSKATHGRRDPPLFLKLGRSVAVWCCSRPQTSAPSRESPAVSVSSRAHHPVSPSLHTHTCLLTALSFPGTQQVSNRIRHFQPPPCHLRHAHLCTLQPKRTASLSHCMCWHHRSLAAQAVPPPAVPSAPRPSSWWYLRTRSLPSALTCHTPVGWAAPEPSWVGSPGACLVSLFSCASATRPR